MRDSVNESTATPNPANKISGDEVRRALDFDVDLSITNENEDNKTEDETTLDAIQIKTIQLQETQKTQQDKTGGAEGQDPISLEDFQLVADKAVNLVLGDSNAVRIHVKDPDVRNISKTGQKAAEIDTLLQAAEAKAIGKSVRDIIIHLGTNDVSKCKDDSAQAMIDVTTAISETHKKFPNAKIAFSSILPRRGKSPAIGVLNDTSRAVNDYIRKLAIKESYLMIIPTPWEVTLSRLLSIVSDFEREGHLKYKLA